MVGFDIDFIYYLIIFILPLLGIISSNIYTSLSSTTWYTNINFILPDISNRSYGLYLSAFVYLCTGLALILLLNYYENKNVARLSIKRESTINLPWILNSREFDSIMLWIIPIIFLLIFLAVPIMFQSQNLIAPAVMYIFISILVIIFLLYSIKFSWPMFFLLIPLAIWVIYLTAFYFTGGTPQETFVSQISSAFQPPTISPPLSTFETPSQTLNTRFTENQSENIPIPENICPSNNENIPDSIPSTNIHKSPNVTVIKYPS